MILGKTTLQALVFISLCICLISSKATHLFGPREGAPDKRFIKLNSQGDPVTSHVTAHDAAPSWECVLDRKTDLVWEIKTNHGLRHRDNTYTWHNPNDPIVGSPEGTRNGGRCTGSACDTSSYLNVINHAGLCGYHNWRLPSREELRSIVDYRKRPPQVTINNDFFPLAKAQFYWSATQDASALDSAWGIGFTFGYDYSYLKSGLGYIRAVTHWKQTKKKQ